MSIGDIGGGRLGGRDERDGHRADRPELLTVFAGESRAAGREPDDVAGGTVPSLVVAKLGAGGSPSAFNAAVTMPLVADVAGWFDAA